MSEYGSAQQITEVGWRLRRAISRADYLRDLALAADFGFSVHEWHGEARDGGPLMVSWVLGDRSGALMSAYEIVARR